MRHLLIGLLAGTVCLGALPAAAAPFAYVPNCITRDVSVIDIATNTVVNTVPLPGVICPRGITINGSGSRAYIASGGNNAISVFDINTETASAAVLLGGGNVTFSGIAVNPAATRAYVTGFGSGQVKVLDLTTNPVTVLATLSGFNQPIGIKINAAGTRAYLAEYGNQQIAVIDLASNSLLAPIPLPGRSPNVMVLSADGNSLWVNHDSVPSGVTRITGLNGVPSVGPATDIPGGSSGSAAAIALNVAGTRVYATDNAVDTVTAISATTGAVIATVSAGVDPGGVSVTPDGNRVLVANFNSNDVSVFDANLVPVAGSPVAVGTRPTAEGDFIPAPYEARPDITDLRSRVVAANLTDTRLRNSLLAPLDAGLAWLNGNDPNKVAYSCSNMAKFIATVRQNISVGKLPAATGNPWVVEANDILFQSGCPTR